MGVVNKWRRLTSLPTMIEVTADGFGENSPKSIKSAIIYRCALFDQAEKIDETVQPQHLNQYINIYLHRDVIKTSFFVLLWPPKT